MNYLQFNVFHHFRQQKGKGQLWKKHIWKSQNEKLSKQGEGLKFYLGLLLFQE